MFLRFGNLVEALRFRGAGKILLAGFLLMQTAPAFAKSDTATPFLCDPSSESQVGWINSSNQSLFLVTLGGDDDYGGLVFSNFGNVSTANAVFTMNIVGTPTTANLGIRLFVKVANGKETAIEVMNPTSKTIYNNHTTLTFDIGKRNYPAGTVMNTLATDVYVSDSSSSGGSIYMYGYQLNSTALTDRVLTSAGCLSL